MKKEKKKNKKHPLRDLSLKWSFVIYMSVFIIIAITASLLGALFFSNLQDAIHTRYELAYRDDIAKQANLVDEDGEIVHKDAVWIYSESLQDKFTEQDSFLYELYGFLAFFSVPVVSLLSVFAAGLTFYFRKLKKPLNILDDASARITAGDLDFTVGSGGKNELGRLSSSFEAMRASLRETNREMWRMMEERSRLNAAFAHDLRAPLTVLKGYNDFLLKYIPEEKVDTKKITSTLLTMGVYLDRLEGYNETMASLQKLDSIELTPLETDFIELCDEFKASAQMMSGAAEKGKTINFRTEGGGAVSVDGEAASRVFENLISNALRYASEEINIYCKAEGGLLSVTVSDDGPGFSPEALIRAKEPYFRDDKENPGAKNFGIGLYISKILCEKHGGGLFIKNGENGGGQVTANF